MAISQMNTALVFQQRKKTFTKYIKLVWSLGIGVAALLAGIIYYLNSIGIGRNNTIGLVCVGTLFVVIITSIIITYKIYKCPICNTVPTTVSGNGGGVNMNPYTCNKCGAKLK